MIQNTFTQRGVPVVDPWSGAVPLSASASGHAGGSVMGTPLSRVVVNDFLRSATDLSIQSVFVNSYCLVIVATYTGVVPKLWNETIDAHRRAVRDATLDTTAALVAEHGLASVTMSKIAEKTGIGRATLYKYFPDVDAILLAWHERQVTRHLEYLAEVRDQADGPGEQLEAVLEAYALIHQRRVQHHRHGRHGGEIAAFLHQDEHVSRAQKQLHAFVRDLIAEAAKAGDLRGDVAPDELASYCLHALMAAGNLPSKAAIHRLVTITLAGLRPSS